VHPPILHCSPTGSVERVICAILENTGTMPVPSFPTWLSPSQVRVIPVTERHLEYAEQLARRLNSEQIRTDLDDRDESVGKKVREAGMDWVPFVVVVGDAEVETGRLTVTIRGKSQPNKPFKETMELSDLIATVKKEIEGMPFRPLYTPMKLSKKARYI
jgi:threonyl-tRNA synthetase